MTEEEKKEEKKAVKPGETAGKWVDLSRNVSFGDSGEQFVKDGRWEADPEKFDYGQAPGEGWAPAVDAGTGSFIGWQNPNIRNEIGWATRIYNPDGTLGEQGMPIETQGQYGYGSKGKQKRNRIFTYVVKGVLGAMFGYGAGAALGAWGGAAAGGEGAAGAAAGEAGGEAALGGLGGVEPISTSGFTAGQGGIGSLGSGWGSSGVVAGEGGAGAAGTSAAPGMGWQDYVRQGMRMKDALSQGQEQQPAYGAGQSTIEQYPMPEDNIDERATALRRATELRARIATLRSRLQEGA